MSQNGAVCVNIGREGINRRRLVGVWALLLGIVAAALVVITGQPLGVRALVFIPFFFGFLGIIQASRRTCAFLGVRGKQNLDMQQEDILDQRTRDVIKLRSIGIILSSALLAALAAGGTMMIPW
jgi:hypothetical protein